MSTSERGVIAALLLLAFVSCAHSQPISITVTPQGPEVLTALIGRRAPALSFLSIDVCNQGNSQLTLDSGRVYQSVSNAGHRPISAYVIDAVVSHEIARNWKSILVSTIGTGSDIGAIASATGIIKADARVTASLVVGGQALRLIASALQKRLPDTSAWRSRILDGAIALGPLSGGQSCKQALMMAYWKPGKTNQETLTLASANAVASPISTPIPKPASEMTAADIDSALLDAFIPSRPDMRR